MRLLVLVVVSPLQHVCLGVDRIAKSRKSTDVLRLLRFAAGVDSARGMSRS